MWNERSNNWNYIDSSTSLSTDTDHDNNRGLSFAPMIYTVLSGTLRNWADTLLDPQVGEYKKAFRIGRSCSDKIN